MIDLHAHVLPQLDDGPRDLTRALRILRALALDGVRTVAATPHVREDWPTTVAAMREALATVRAAAAQESIPIDVVPGGELSLERVSTLSDEERAGFGLGGNPDVLLIEFPYRGWPLRLRDVVLGLRSRGVVPVLAHPERNPEVRRRPERLVELVRDGAFVQLTAASVGGALGASTRSCALRLVELGCAHLLATDAHDEPARAARLSTAGAALGELGTWMTVDAPAALLAESELPMPPRRARRRLLGRLGAPARRPPPA